MVRMTAAATVALLFFLPGAILTASAVDSGGFVDPEDFGALGNVTSPPDDNATRASNLTGEANVSLNETLAGGNGTCGHCNESSQEAGLNESVQGLAGPEPVEDIGLLESSIPQNLPDEKVLGKPKESLLEGLPDEHTADKIVSIGSSLARDVRVPVVEGLQGQVGNNASLPDVDSVWGNLARTNTYDGNQLMRGLWNQPDEAENIETPTATTGHGPGFPWGHSPGFQGDASIIPSSSAADGTPSGPFVGSPAPSDPGPPRSEPMGPLSTNVNLPGSLPGSMSSVLVLAVGALTGTAVLAANPKVALALRRAWWLLYKSIPFIGVGLFSRLPKDKLLEQKNRELVFLAIKRSPGIQIFELVSLLDFKRSTIRHHLRVLEDNNKIIQGREPPHTFLYALEDPPAPKHVLAKAPHPVDQSILRLLEKKPGITRQEIAELLGISVSQSYRRVAALKKKGLVGGVKSGKGKVLKLHASLGYSPSSHGEEQTQ